MKRDLINSAIGVVILTLLLGIAYPLAVTGVSQLAFPGNANGQRLYASGRLVGSKIIGQSFSADPRFFQSRPSATAPAYNAAASTFSNLGPNSTLTEKAIASNIAAYINLNGPYNPGLTVATVPVDAANSSASGLDPDISFANADIQAHRVAQVRGLSLGRVDALIARYTSGRGLGFSGEPGVDVLELNLALDRIGSGVTAERNRAAGDRTRGSS